MDGYNKGKRIHDPVDYISADASQPTLSSFPVPVNMFMNMNQLPPRMYQQQQAMQGGSAAMGRGGRVGGKSYDAGRQSAKAGGGAWRAGQSQDPASQGLSQGYSQNFAQGLSQVRLAVSAIIVLICYVIINLSYRN